MTPATKAEAPERTLRITLSFPGDIYSGSSLGMAELIPSQARIHEAFVAAAAGGPWAERDNRVLVATDEHRRAVEWLEQYEPIAVKVPDARRSDRRATRFRIRAKLTPDDTEFEPRSALSGEVVYYWEEAPQDVIDALATIACEVTHIGRADSVVVVRVDQGAPPEADADVLVPAEGRGPGEVLRIPLPGRFDELERTHREALRPGTHSTGSPKSVQAKDVQLTGANETATELRRFGRAATPDWPFAEVVRAEITEGTKAGRIRDLLLSPNHRVAAAVGVHRALIRKIDELAGQVPPFVTGRDGIDPQRGAGHLAIHVEPRNGDGEGPVDVLLGIPRGVPDSEREMLIAALTQASLRAGIYRQDRNPLAWFSLKKPTFHPAFPYWQGADTVMESRVPVLLEAPGGPRRGNHWTIERSATCSIGYAMRGPLERSGIIEWDTGWGFREHLVETLENELGVIMRAWRVRGNASRYAHRANEHDLLVAVDIHVDLGDLARIGIDGPAAPGNGGFLAIGRARHMGGGLLRPLLGESPS